MNTAQVRIHVHHDDNDSAVIPVALPSLTEVRALAERLHALNSPYHDVLWGWPVDYEPELREDHATFEVPDGCGGYRTEIAPFWSPAMFTIGESGVWFYSLTWEHGKDQPPVEFLDDRNVISA